MLFFIAAIDVDSHRGQLTSIGRGSHDKRRSSAERLAERGDALAYLPTPPQSVPSTVLHRTVRCGAHARACSGGSAEDSGRQTGWVGTAGDAPGEST